MLKYYIYIVNLYTQEKEKTGDSFDFYTQAKEHTAKLNETLLNDGKVAIVSVF